MADMAVASIYSLVIESLLMCRHYRLIIAAQSSQTCPQNLTTIYPCGPNSTAMVAYIFPRLHLANPLPLCDRFLRLSFVFRDKIINNHKCGESVSIGVIDQVRSANDDPNALLQINREMATRVPVDPRPAGLLLSDPRVAAQLV